ncbi:MAG: hypothetical protein K2X93_22985 [Candidatus Obscuribacterales bacterium]|nr:hypothetical protein [Candidatus Obscuribacterales bacterium]
MKITVKVLHELRDNNDDDLLLDTMEDEFPLEIEGWMNEEEIKQLAWCAANRRLKTKVEWEVSTR